MPMLMNGQIKGRLKRNIMNTEKIDDAFIFYSSDTLADTNKIFIAQNRRYLSGGFVLRGHE